MKTLYLTSNGSNIYVEPETNSCGKIDSSREAINRIYLVDEEMHIVYQAGEYKRELDAAPGDIIVTFYENAFVNRIVVVKNEDWAENLIKEREEEQKRKEEWAAQIKDAKCATCENCESVAKPY